MLTCADSVLVSGAYPRKGPKVRKVEQFAQLIARTIAERDGSVVSGNGPTIGNALVDGIRAVKGSETFQYITIVPFKQHGTVAEMTHSQRSEYFHHVSLDLISKANIVLFLSGEKMAQDGTLTNSDTVFNEFSLATEQHRWPIPIAVLGGSAAAIHGRIRTDIQRKIHPYKDLPDVALFDKLADETLEPKAVIEAALDIAAWVVATKLTSANDSRSRRSSVSSVMSNDGGKEPATTVFGSMTPRRLPSRINSTASTSGHLDNLVISPLSPSTGTRS